MSEERNTYEPEDDILANSSMIPNIIDDMELSVYAVRLYLRFKRRVKQLRNGKTAGEAFDSTKTLAAECGMSAPTVTRAKRELVAAGLIKIEKRTGKHGEYPSDHITVLNIWEANQMYYSNGFYLSDKSGEPTYTGKEARKIIRENPELKRELARYIAFWTADETTEMDRATTETDREKN